MPIISSPLFPVKKRHVTEPKDTQDKVSDLLYCIENTHKEILCTCSEKQHDLWENEMLLQAIRSFMERRLESRLVFIFSIVNNHSTDEEVIRSLKEKNPKLHKILVGHYDKVKVFVTPIERKAHFIVFDDSVMFESNRHSQSGVVFILDRPEVTQEWRSNFWKLADLSHELQISSR